MTDLISDINECVEDLHNCSLFENKTCSNTNGSFECVCYDGYEEIGDCVGMYDLSSNLFSITMFYHVCRY